jgi:scyllo-inositol 2-dehydrogenase (NADP+)
LAPDARVALIGFGLAGSVFHAPLIAGARGLELTTIVTSDPERGERAATEYPRARVEADRDALWARADEHDLVVVASPNDSHVGLATTAIDAGLGVVVDKPLAPTSDAARELVERARERGGLLTVFHNRRWDSDQLTLRRLLAQDALGDVHRYESRFERWRPEVRAGAWREETAPTEGGGLLLDLATHLVDQARTLFGPPRRVYGEVVHRRGGPADDDVFIALEHEGGTISHLWASSVAGAIGPRLRVLGSRAAFVVKSVDGQEDALKAGARPRTSAEWGAEPSERWGRLVRGARSEPVPAERGNWPVFYERVAAALAGSGPPPVDPDDAVAVLEILERARSSYRGT